MLNNDVPSEHLSTVLYALPYVHVYLMFITPLSHNPNSCFPESVIAGWQEMLTALQGVVVATNLTEALSV